MSRSMVIIGSEWYTYIFCFIYSRRVWAENSGTTTFTPRTRYQFRIPLIYIFGKNNINHYNC